MRDISLRRAVEQFAGLLSSRQASGYISEQDQQDITGLIQELSAVEGDASRLLREHPSLMVRTSWYAHNFQVWSLAAERQATQKLNEVYNQLRYKGHNEWDAKRKAEADADYVKLLAAQDTYNSITNILIQLKLIAEQRLRILEQLSNNYRTEVRQN